MANSPKGAGNFLAPLFIVAVMAVVALVATFMLSSEEIPDEPTIIAQDDINARPVGAGTRPEGEVDPYVDGVTDKLEQVEPAAPGVETVPPAEMDDTAQTDAAPAPSEETGSDEASDASDSDAAAEEPDPIVDDTSGDGVAGDGVTDDSAPGLPAGRDTQTEVTPQEGQDVVTDTDEGGTAFVPTPSGPEGRDNTTIAE